MCGPRGLEGQEDVFYRNDGMRFVEAMEESGLDDRIRAYGIGVVSSDYDGDGDADLYVANDTRSQFSLSQRRKRTLRRSRPPLGRRL